MDRKVVPEILDSLPANDASALASRRDLRRYNRIMGNFHWLTGVLQRHRRPEESAVELAPGDGAFGQLLTRGSAPPFRQPGSVLGLDRLPRPRAWPSAWPWQQTDLLEWEDYSGRPVVFGNFILHHFTGEQLARLGSRWNRNSRLLVFNETLRSIHALWLARTSFLLGVHAVTRHDALASIRAGFRGEELARLLQLDRGLWKWQVQHSLLGAYRFIALRRDSAEP